MGKGQRRERMERRKQAKIAVRRKLVLGLPTQRWTIEPKKQESIKFITTAPQSSSAPAPPPIYRLVIPANQLAVINQFDPELKVMRIYGAGSFSGSSTEEPFEYGKIVAKPVGSAVVEYNYDQGLKPLSQIFECCRGRNIPNVALDTLEYQDSVQVSANKTLYIALKFEKETILPKKYQKLVINGAFPKQEMYEILREIKRRLEELPDDVKRRWRPSCLVLTDIAPDRKLLYEGDIIWALKRNYMLFVRETQRRWELHDYVSKPRGGP